MPSGNRRHTRLLTRVAAATLVATSLTAIAAASPAEAARITTTKFAFNTAAWGTRLVVSPVGTTSGDTAFSMIGCTRRTGLTNGNNVAGVHLPGLALGAVVSDSNTFKDAAGNAGTQSTSRIATLTLGTGPTALVVKGLEGYSKAWHRAGGGFAARNDFSFISAKLGPVALPKNAFAGQGVTVPGAGQVGIGYQNHASGARGAIARAASLKVHLFGPDRVPGGTDDISLFIGSTVAQAQKGAIRGVMRGEAYGLHLSALNGVATSQRNILLPLGCTGTNGRTITRSLATVAPSNQLSVSGLFSKVYGIQGHPKRGLTAITQSGVADVNLGNGKLVIKGVLGKVRVYRDGRGHIHRVPTQSVLGITANGKTYPAPALGQTLTIPGLGSITSPKPLATRAGMTVVALRVSFLPGTPGATLIDLGTARADVRRK